MEQSLGYFCRAYVGRDVQANVIARTLKEAELEITRMIRGGAMSAHAVQHGWRDHEPVLVATAYGGMADGEIWRYLRHKDGPEFEQWQTAFHSKTKILDESWVVIECSSAGIKEYGAFGKAVRAVWGSAAVLVAVGNERTASRTPGIMDIQPKVGPRPAASLPLNWKTG